MLIIFCDQKTSRIEYTFGLIFRELLGVNYLVTTDKEAYENHEGPKIWYSLSPCPQGICFVPANLLTSRGIKSFEPECITYDDMVCLFPVKGKSELPYDPFSAIFYMVSRYEEYLPFLADAHGRFSAKESFAGKHGFLHKPVVNYWAMHIGNLISQHYPDFLVPGMRYRFILTVDIDAAWAFRHKGLLRTVGGLGKALTKFDFTEFNHRQKVLAGKEKDPFDTFNLLFNYQRRQALEMICFILLGDYGPYDKNISWQNYHFQDLIKRIGDYASLGIHPSYQSSSQAELIKREMDRLQQITRKQVVKSRQHYLRLQFPTTYRALISLGIEEDYSMGFADDYGFRAGICSPYYFYDLELEQISRLRIFPFAFMDGTLKDYLRLSPEEADVIIQQLINEVKKTNGTFIALWHNESLSNEDRWVGWKEVCDKMIEIGNR